MKARWTQPQKLRLATRLDTVVSGLRAAMPVLLSTHVRAVESMTAAAELAEKRRDKDG